MQTFAVIVAIGFSAHLTTLFDNLCRNLFVYFKLELASLNSITQTVQLVEETKTIISKIGFQIGSFSCCCGSKAVA